MAAARNDRLIIVLSDPAAHMLEHVDSEARVALQPCDADVRGGACRGGDSRNSKRVRSGGRVALDGIGGRVDVGNLEDLVRVLALDRLNVDAKGARHSDGHVDVRLRDDLAAVSTSVTGSAAYGAQSGMLDTYWLKTLAANLMRPPLRPLGAMESRRQPSPSR